MKVSEEASELLSSLVRSPMLMHTTAIKPNGLFAAQFQERNLREARSNTVSSLPTGEARISSVCSTVHLVMLCHIWLSIQNR